MKEFDKKMETFIEQYDCTRFDDLPKFIKRRVDALKKIQLAHIDIEHQYHLELQELELKYEKLYQPLYEKRFKIITGEYEPTDDECQLPANIIDNEYNGDQENNDDSKFKVFDSALEKKLEAEVKGIPGFWLGCLVSTFNFNDSIEPHDRQVLRYLTDIRLAYKPAEENITYQLEFLFDDNPFFTNKVLTKTYHLKSKPDEKDPFRFEGLEVFKSEGCEINWNPGKDVTHKTVTVKQQNKSDGRTREKKKEVERDSFFYFFKPPQMPEGGIDEEDGELNGIMAIDFELGEVIRQSIIPKATLYYTGYMMDQEDDDDEDDIDDDEDEDDDDSDEDDDDELTFESDSNESDESSDSLNKDKKDPKKSTSPKKSPKSASKP